MDLNFYKSVGNPDSPLRRIDGRVKTIFFLFGIIICTMVSHWYLAAALWLGAVVMFSTLRLPWRLLFRRLYIPFGIAWLVFASLIFTFGSHPVFNVIDQPFHLAIYSEGIVRGVLIMFRIMAAVTLASVLSFSTPMVEILETLRILRIPGMMVDIADMMFRYVFILDEAARNMRHAQMSRTTRRLSRTERIRNAGKIAVNVMSRSLDRSVRVYQAMMSRGHSEENRMPAYFTGPVSSADLRAGLFLAIFPIVVLAINYII